ncbi:hypothetical protein GLOTRDRAFT_134465 [Gloeophyllum trabeum ATCC 11539]|uniref:Uncharacterized protein n=1 Tax=Gloeophyllum trabeum (strain ATCC 11539 / FP-39264 / Madison 617) TaxID=670483 RepID=S7PR98_GLOTA|nr:uncharacterized protein GLOTRDRAFT_134465 [Gloeophyllum trabeum ATCC 11539]EPQ49917.1 hypothetical protein GLOTRDRAFT_134465 [Gloeophyllum trabeum ATCC 11539]
MHITLTDLNISPTEEDIKVLDALVRQVDPDPDVDMEDTESITSSHASKHARIEEVTRADVAADSNQDDNQSIDWGSDMRQTHPHKMRARDEST